MILDEDGKSKYEVHELSERYSLFSIHNLYILDYELLKRVEVDLVFGDGAFCKPKNKRICLLEVLYPSTGKKFSYFKLFKRKTILNFGCEGKGQRDLEQFEKDGGDRVAETVSFHNFMFLKGYKLQDFRANPLQPWEFDT